MQFGLDAMLPVPDGGLGYANDLGDIPLKETKVHSFFSYVLTNGGGMFGVAGKCLFSQGNAD